MHEQLQTNLPVTSTETALAHAMSLAQLVAWEYDLASGLFTFSDRYFALHGTTCELEGGYRIDAGTFARRFVHPDDAHLVAEEIAKATAASDPNYHSHVECRILRRDGKLRQVLVHIGIAQDAEGRTIQLRGANQDITERKQSEQELRKLWRAVEQTPATVVITNVNGAIEYVNPKFVEITGYTVAEALGQNPRVLKSGKHPPEFYQAMWQTLLRGDLWHGELQNKRKNGEIYWESACISPVRDPNGAITHFIAVKEDITRRKQAEAEMIEINRQLAEANARANALAAELEQRVQHRTFEVEQLLHRMEDLLHHLSHDLKTPLTPLLSLLPMLLETESDVERREMLGLALDGARNVHALAARVLELCRAGDPAPAPSSSAENLYRLAEATLAQCRMTHRLEDRVLRNEVPTESTVRADPMQVRQVLASLLDNAVKFTAPGGVVTIRAVAGNGSVSVAVADDGIGLEQQQLARVFEPFFKVDPSRHDRGAAGLGLSIAKAIVERQGGRIWAESPGPRCGATFWFTLPSQIPRTS